MAEFDAIVGMIGEDEFRWLAQDFSETTCLKDVPEKLIRRFADVDITSRNYVADPNAVTAIALLTFAYRIAHKPQNPQAGPKDIILLKVLAKQEFTRRTGAQILSSSMWGTPLYELITGEVGEHIRTMPMMHSSM